MACDDFQIFMNMGFFVSVCARASKTKSEVEEFVNEDIENLYKPPFQCVDVAIARKGPSTPHPCPDVEGRTHWFLVAGTENDFREAVAMTSGAKRTLQ